MWLGFDVVTKNAVRVPLGDVPFVIGPIGIKERSVQMHPPALNKIVCDRKAYPLVAVFGQILLNSPRTNGASDFKLLLFAVYAGEFHLVRSILLNHLCSIAMFSDFVFFLILCRIAL